MRNDMDVSSAVCNVVQSRTLMPQHTGREFCKVLKVSEVDVYQGRADTVVDGELHVVIPFKV